MTQFRHLSAANAARQKLWDPDDKITPSFRGLELAGEAGEVCNKLKKLERARMGLQGSKATTQELADELADVVICAFLIAADYGIRLDMAVASKFNETSEAQGFDVTIDPFFVELT